MLRITVNYKLRVLCLACNIAFCTTQGTLNAADGASSQESDCDNLIDTLASHNQSPQLVRPPMDQKLSEDVDENGPVPIFSKDFDWRDQDRVVQGIRELFHKRSSTMWECLVRHSDDKRYCITMRSDNHRVINQSVGDICTRIAFEQLTFPYKKHMSVIRDGHRMSLDIGITELKQWRQSRIKKQLYELQSEVCSIAMVQLDGLDSSNIPEQSRVTMKKLLEQQVVELQKNKHAEMDPELRLSKWGYDLYDATKAMELEESVSARKK